MRGSHDSPSPLQAHPLPWLLGYVFALPVDEEEAVAMTTSLLRDGWWVNHYHQKAHRILLLGTDSRGSPKITPLCNQKREFYTSAYNQEPWAAHQTHCRICERVQHRYLPK